MILVSTWLSYFKSIVQDAQQREWKLPPPQQVRRPQSRNQQPSLAISRSGEPFSPTGSSFSDRSQTREEDLPYHLDTTLYIAPPPLPRSSYPSSETSSLSSYANNSSSSERRISTAPSWSTAPSSAYNMNSPPPIIEVCYFPPRHVTWVSSNLLQGARGAGT